MIARGRLQYACTCTFVQSRGPKPWAVEVMLDGYVN